MSINPGFIDSRSGCISATSAGEEIFLPRRLTAAFYADLLRALTQRALIPTLAHIRRGYAICRTALARAALLGEAGYTVIYDPPEDGGELPVGLRSRADIERACIETLDDARYFRVGLDNLAQAVLAKKGITGTGWIGISPQALSELSPEDIGRAIERLTAPRNPSSWSPTAALRERSLHRRFKGEGGRHFMLHTISCRNTIIRLADE